MVALARSRAAIAAVVLLLFALPVTAEAEEVTTAELAQLIADAAEDQESRNRLLEVTSLDGEPIDMGAILSADAEDDASRLDTLEGLLADRKTTSLDGAELRTEAADIVSKPPFTAAAASSSSILDRLWRFISSLFGNDGAQGLALIAIVVVALLVAIPVLNRLVVRRHDQPNEVTMKPVRRDFYAEAQNAAATGDHEAAVRLLVLDGADYLESRRVVPNAATTSTATVRPIATETHFLDRFDEIAYGGDAAVSQDVGEAISSWQRLKRRFT